MLLSFTIQVTYLCTACSDPGIHPRFTEAPPGGWPSYPGYFAETGGGRRRQAGTGTEYTWSGQAQSYRKPGVAYCSETRVLIQDIDHFCPWTGTTIAVGNLRCFHAFLCSIMLLLVVTVVIVVR